MMKNLKVRTKLFFLVGVVGLVSIVIGVVNVYNLKRTHKGITEVFEKRVKPLTYLKMVADAVAVDIVDLSHKTYHGNISWKKASQDLDLAGVVVKKGWNSYLNADLDQKERIIAEEGNKILGSAMETYKSMVEIVRSGKSINTQAELDYLIKNKLYQTIDPFSSKVDELIQLQLDESEVITIKAGEIYTFSILQTFIFITVGGVLSFVLSLFIVKGITLQLGGEPVEVLDIARKVAVGELNIKSKNKRIGALGALMDMVERLAVVIDDIKGGADSMMQASRQLNDSSQQLNHAANEQASSVEEISSTMEEMVSNISSNSHNSQLTEKIASDAKNGIDHVAEQTQLTIHANKDISLKTSIISDIAFQTNILALNAAVEAANSGEHGRGFAVVATEVRKLAEKSHVAAEEISKLVAGGLETASIAGDQMNSILPEVEKTASLVKEISSASTEQNAGAEQVNNSLQQLNTITQQNAAAGEELAASSEEMTAQAEKLKESVAYFNL